MTQHYTCMINLIVLGPFLTAATGPDRYGVDKSAHRDHMERLVIPASHLKGKLRSSLEELENFFDPDDRPDLNLLFGEPSAEGTYAPLPAILRFSDMICENEDIRQEERTHTRVTINRISRTAEQNLLREVDKPFQSGAEIRFNGKVSFRVSDAEAALKLARVLRIGFQWLATIGSEKGVGFGRLKSVQLDTPKNSEVSDIQILDGTNNALQLRITAQEPIFAGSIKNRRTNYIFSRKELSGGLIKGALAAALNEAHGVCPVTRPLDERNASDFSGFELLIKHFSAIRITHALPTHVGKPRPIRLPLSAVEHSDANETIIGDVALSSKATPLVLDRYSPAYYGDAKSLIQFEGLAEPAELFVTRSEIDDLSQRTAEGQLFTYQFYAPYTLDKLNRKQPIEWVCNANFDAIENSAERNAVCQQFSTAVQRYLHRLGKLGRTVTIMVKNGLAAPAMGTRGLILNDLVLVTLQSNAIILAPDSVCSLPLGQDLHELYAAYWHEVSNGALVLDDFFAHQGFEGGYLYHRYLGAAERDVHPNRYRPYYLTLAGSLFKLKVVNEVNATNLLTRWKALGLPLPMWALAEYGQYNRELWENCPFIPENGYGEIAVNLTWHWEPMKSISMPQNANIER